RNDRMGMMASVESRIPFLENELVRFAVNLPARFKVPGHPLRPAWRHPLKTNKWALREVARQLLPEALFRRKKMGFPVSPTDYLQLEPEYFEGGFILDALQVPAAHWQAIWRTSGEEFRWNAFAAELWGRRFFLGSSTERLAREVAGLSRRPG